MSSLKRRVGYRPPWWMPVFYPPRKVEGEGPTFVAGTAYRYVDPADLERRIRSYMPRQGRIVVFGALAICGLALFLEPTLPIFLVALFGTAGSAWAAIHLDAQDRRKWETFRRTLRGTILAVDGGIKFSGDPRIYRRHQTRAEFFNLRFNPDSKLIYETYVADKETILVARRYLEPADLPLTTLSTRQSVENR